MGFDCPEPITEAAKQWEGWGTGLKPSVELVSLSRKPLSEKTVAANVLRWGTGALNIDGCRVPATKSTVRQNNGGTGNLQNWRTGKRGSVTGSSSGRWPANLITDGSDEVLAAFPETTVCGGPKKTHGSGGLYGTKTIGAPGTIYRDDSRSAARFFKSCEVTVDDRRLIYCAKASKSERGEGNNHCTVKPLALMRYLCRLITPPGGTILDPFIGSGTTALACIQEGFHYIGFERDEDSYHIALSRLDATSPSLFSAISV